MQLWPREAEGNVELEGYTVIWPSVSYGNIGQLAVDLLINSHFPQLKCIGHVYSKYVLPMAGSGAFDSSSPLCINLEAYIDVDRKLLFVQQRTALRSDKSVTFAKELVEWLNSQNIRSLILLAGVDGSTRHDPAEMSSPICCSERSDYFNLKGMGIAPVVSSLIENVELKTFYIPTAAEGDNLPEASSLAMCVQSHLKLELTALTPPESWKAALYGRKPDASIY